MTRKEIISLVILILVISYGAWRYFNLTYSDEKRDSDLLNTLVRVSGESKSRKVGAQIQKVFDYMRVIEDKFNDYDPDSWISKLNSAKGKPYPMDPDAYAILSIADSLYRMTNGAFDISIKPLYDLWGFSASDALFADSLQKEPPDSLAIKQALAKIGFDRIKYNTKSITLPPGMQISFGALAKGYTLDKSREYMQQQGFIKGEIDCTSSMTFFGRKISQIVGIAHPRAEQTQQQTIGSFKLKNGSLSTSGDYQLYFDYQGKRYHHILNPKTGYPVENVYSVTVVHPSAAWADGLSTALFLMHPDTALEALRMYPGSNAVIFYQDKGEIVALKSLGMKNMSWHDQ